MKVQMYMMLLLAFIISSCSNSETQPRSIEDFNFNWKFIKGEHSSAETLSYNDTSWEDVRLPHDWSILAGYQKENTAASTGFSEGGIGWYRKEFQVPKTDEGKAIWIEFDGIYNNAAVWINGTKLGFRPNGYASFSYDLTEHLNYGENNVVAVRVDHTAYVDSRWYTGSGIYRDVRLVKTSKVHIPQWGVRVTTPNVDKSRASVHFESKVVGANDNVEIETQILDGNGTQVAYGKTDVLAEGNKGILTLNVENPSLWGIQTPNLYTAIISIKHNGALVDKVTQEFGIRKFRFDSNKGFFLNGENVKIKGVNLHHDAGAVGAAANKATWEYRISKLKSIGVNAVRMAHNPHSPLLMEVCDEMGILVMNEFFDEWHNPKAKSVNHLGDNAAGDAISKGYSDIFFEWAEKDLKTLIQRDFNHPSVIMWSIGNEIEWTFPHYSKTYSEVEGEIKEYKDPPTYDLSKIKPVFDRLTGGVDSLSIVAHKLSKWVKEEDTTRPVVCGSVRPTIAFASGYADAVDVLGLNYRAIDYDVAHKAFPEKCLLGSENWVAYSEWKAALERDFIPGIFVWTGFAYLGEAGPWPRKGLNISLFDFAGFKNPRGHFFECLWKEDPKVYMVTTPASDSEFSFTEKEGWKFDIQYTPPPVWNKLRLWEWYKVNEHWNYDDNEPIVVQTYTNCEEAELFLNGKSLGKQALADFKEEDNIIKWLVPHQKGELKVIGYNNGKKADEYTLLTTSKPTSIKLDIDKPSLKANNYDIAHVYVTLYDETGNKVTNANEDITFHVSEGADLVAVDNGWEMNVNPHNTNKVQTHKGRALAIIRSKGNPGTVTVTAKMGDIKSNVLSLSIE
ncbi:glycoside hydrolase family 2 TIM barrel-domain containing protein [Seonamhaeicola marinus]|uniref:Glycoside hydrolase family 2 protein n=1 Tax=Seonamhaeicola marinus TaxID=1912246 RepID=A0A5D0HKB1_9FLAO|nr:glycoside hydrolase family 2 TIM barrel-domain containing protein [Seonamhaeicola marinus]TYA71746.1 glycoside hydrolase family 2 protein [Seonamhaeicola marinus]